MLTLNLRKLYGRVPASPDFCCSCALVAGDRGEFPRTPLFFFPDIAHLEVLPIQNTKVGYCLSPTVLVVSDATAMKQASPLTFI